MAKPLFNDICKKTCLRTLYIQKPLYKLFASTSSAPRGGVDENLSVDSSSPGAWAQESMCMQPGKSEQVCISSGNNNSITWFENDIGFQFITLDDFFIIHGNGGLLAIDFPEHVDVVSFGKGGQSARKGNKLDNT